MKNLSNKLLYSLTLIALLSACGKKEESNKEPPRTVVAAQEDEAIPVLDGSHIQGHYSAKFITLNPHVNGTIPGSANFFRKEDKLYAYVRLFAGGPRAWHQQFVYEGNRCPTLGDDTNGDGFIDIVEAEKVLGKVIIPMDSDIGSQNSGRRFFPLADLSGYYHYERITSFKRFLSDLQDADTDGTDNVRKLAADEPLRISGSTFMVLGVLETVQLPESVATKGRHRAFQTLPIACGTFVKINTVPGQPYSEEVPGPIAEVQPNQDRPAGDIPEGPTDGSTTGSTTGTNDSDDGDGPVSDGEGRTTSGTTSGSTNGGTTGSTSGGSTGSGTNSGSTNGSTTGGSTGSGTNSGSTNGSTAGGSTGSGTNSGSTTGGPTGSTASGTNSGTTTGNSVGGATTGPSITSSFGF